jgi:hypothetical protein
MRFKKSKLAIHLSPDSMQDVQVTGEAFSPQKKTLALPDQDPQHMYYVQYISIYLFKN